MKRSSVSFPFFNNTIYQLVWLLFLFVFIAKSVSSQDTKVQISVSEGNTLDSPWAGGMNSMQFGELDINRDGIKDLFAFDRMGNRNMCFINQGIEGQINYTYSPEYNDLLPQMYDWMILADYNNDGKEDIFTYSPGWAGMLVYKNVSDNSLKFELVVSPYLSSYQGGGYVNLYVTYVDYPGIVDIDNDGDLDIFSFWGLGSFLNYHKNLSMEKYGNADSLDYELVEYCWGKFAESDESNEIFLDTCLNSAHRETQKERHTGSTLLFLDLDGDNDKDLLLGDIDYPGLFALINGGTPENAFITEVDTMFPSNTQRAYIFAMPAAAYIDVNNDGKKDLLLSPFDPALEVSENKNSVWLYINSGENNNPVFTLNTKDFLQAQMLDFGSGAYPSLFDWDGDGLNDLFVGNFGNYLYSFYQNYFLYSVNRSSISYYKNIGNALQPEFQLMNNDFGNLGQLNKLGLVPTLGNLTADQLPDMLAGSSDGKLLFLKNSGNGDLDLVDENYFSIDVGEFSAPQLFDLDKDGLTDLIVGEKNGNLNYFKNQGTNAEPDFVFITDSLGKVNVTDYNLSYYGYSTPCFFRTPQGETQLVVGSESGQIFYYQNIDGNLGGEFQLSNELAALLDTNNISFDLGIRTAAAIGEIKIDGKTEMIAGNYSGGLQYFNGYSEVLPGFVENLRLDKKNLHISPNPATAGKIKIGNLPEAGNYEIQVYQANGKLALTKSIYYEAGEKIIVDISSLNSGIFFIKAFNSSISLSAKFLVQ